MTSRQAVRGLLIRGMLAGLAAGVLAFVVAKLLGEPQVAKAIAFEDAQNAGAPSETALVSRGMQSTLGLLTATVVYGVAMGGIFALAFAGFHGRIGTGQPRVTALVLALVGLLVIIVVPFTKYPSNPPAVGADDTIGYRTQIYFAMIAISIAGAVAALRIGRDAVRRLGAFNGVLAGVGAYLVLMVVAQLVLPVLDETPAGFSSSVIWHFRVATLAMHLVLWSTLALVFGAAAQRLLSGAGAGGRYRTSSPSAAAPDA